jgi:hypothetical protein
MDDMNSGEKERQRDDRAVQPGKEKKKEKVRKGIVKYDDRRYPLAIRRC